MKIKISSLLSDLTRKPKTANSTTTAINFIGGTGITTAVSGDNLTITNSAPNTPQFIIQSVSGDTGS